MTFHVETLPPGASSLLDSGSSGIDSGILPHPPCRVFEVALAGQTATPWQARRLQNHERVARQRRTLPSAPEDNPIAARKLPRAESMRNNRPSKSPGLIPFHSDP